MAATLSIIYFSCIIIGLCLPIFSIYGYKQIEKYAEYPSVLHRSDCFVRFSCTIWCISCVAIPSFVYIACMVYNYSFAAEKDFYLRLILHSSQLYLTLNILMVKICKLHYTINQMIDTEKWFCCHMIDKYWLHSLYIINYELFGRGSNLLLFCSVYLCFAVLIITFCSIFTLSSTNNLLIEYCASFIMALIPLIFFAFIYKNSRSDEKYFVDDHFMLKEIFALILVYTFYILSPFIMIILFHIMRYRFDIILCTHMITNTISCVFAIFISLRFGVWAAIDRHNIIKQERHKLNNDKRSNNEYYNKYQRDIALSNINENDAASDTPQITIAPHNILYANRYKMYLHSTLKTNKARTPIRTPVFIAMDEFEDNPYKFAREHMNSKSSIDEIEKVFFADLLNFRYGFYCFSEYLRKQNALHYLAFIVEMNQFETELFFEMDQISKYRKRKLTKRKYEWISNINFKFLPRGDCQYINRHNIVFHAWNIYKKYIQKSKNRHINISHALPRDVVDKIGNVLENIYQHYQFLYSQKKYYFKYQKQRKSISDKYKISPQPFKSRHNYKLHRYVSSGSFGKDHVSIYGDFEANEISISQSRSISIENIEIISDTKKVNKKNINGYQSLSACVSPYDDDDDDDVYDDAYELLADENEALLDIEPLSLILNNCDADHDTKEAEEELDLDTNAINRILLLNDIQNKEEEDEKEKEEENNNNNCEMKDIWSVIEEPSNAKISVELSTLYALSQVFEDAIYLIWDQLLQHYQIFKNQSDDYLICRYKLRATGSSQRKYMRQRNNQKIKTPRNRNDPIPFWIRKKRKMKTKTSAFNYNSLQHLDPIQIVQYNQ